MHREDEVKRYMRQRNKKLRAMSGQQKEAIKQHKERMEKYYNWDDLKKIIDNNMELIIEIKAKERKWEKSKLAKEQLSQLRKKYGIGCLCSHHEWCPVCSEIELIEIYPNIWEEALDIAESLLSKE